MGEIYFNLGFWHILDWEGYDHILFLLVLLACYAYYEWKHILILITAFTLGHALTLLLGGLNLVSLPSNIVEFGIALTIFLTALLNFLKSRGRDVISYVVIAIFGLIHGLGFSSFFKALLSESDSLISVLLFFNLGVEVGQVVFVLLILSLNYIYLRWFGGNQKWWNYVLSGVGLMVSFYLMIDRV